jgi:hypothetical protein
MRGRDPGTPDRARADDGALGRLSRWVEHRSAPVAASVFTLVVVMAFSMLAHQSLHVGRTRLDAPADLWSLAASSSAIWHGHFSQIYVHQGALTSPPAFEIALAPFIGLGQLLGLAPHLHKAGQPLSLWFVLGPAAVFAASTVLFALDAVARAWKMTEGARLALALVGALGVANVAGGWGHPEDCIAVAFVVWAALHMERFGTSGARRAALLLGLGVAFQPLALLGVAPVLARLHWRAVPRLVPRLVLPSAAALVLPLAAEPHQTFFVLVHQPFQPRFISFTPLTHLAPVIGPGLDGGGPSRLIAIVVSAALAVAVCHRRHDLPTVLSLCAVGFFVRVLLETELNWYYLWPVPALCLALALRRSRARFWTCAVALVASIVLGDRKVHHLVPWWPALMGLLVLMLLTAAPSPMQWVDAARRWLRATPSIAGPVEFGPMMEPVGTGRHRE